MNVADEGPGQILAPFLGKIETFPARLQTEDFLSHPFAKLCVDSNVDLAASDEKFADRMRGCSKSSFEAFVRDVQLSKDTRSVLAGQLLMQNEGLSFVLLQASADDKKLINQIVKLPDILCNAFEGELPEGLKVEDLVEHILYNILLCHRFHILAGNSNTHPLLEVLAHR